MQPSVSDAPFKIRPGLDLAFLHDLLEDSGYNAPTVQGLMRACRVHGALDLRLLHSALAEPTHLNLLVRLFTAGRAVLVDEARTMFALEAELETLFEIGLLRLLPERPGYCEAVAKLTPVEGFHILGDFDVERPERPWQPEHVIGAGPASNSLSVVTPRRPVRSVLDMGAGSGVQAMLASTHAGSITATDLSPRALNFAALTALINGVEGVELLQGSFFEPVAGRAFDLVVSNPPYVISPDTQYVFRDGGLGGDLVSEHVTRHAAEHLLPGGLAILLVSWHHRQGEDPFAKLRLWTGDLPTDNLLVHYESGTPISYAAGWLHSALAAGQSSQETYAADLRRWLDYYEAIGAECLCIGTVILRRRADERPGWTRALSAPGGAHAGDCGEQLLRIMAAEDFLQRPGSREALVSARLALHPEHSVEQSLRLGPKGWQPTRVVLKQTEGFAFGGKLDGLALHFLEGCTGRRTVADLVASASKLSGTPEGELLPDLLDLCTQLLRHGLLTVAD